MASAEIKVQSLGNNNGSNGKANYYWKLGCSAVVLAGISLLSLTDTPDS